MVAKGDARPDNKKLKTTFGAKARMLSSDEVVNATGHPVGGVCPFGLEHPLPVYCDISLKGYNEVLPAAGATHSAVRITPERMAELTSATGRRVPITCLTPGFPEQARRIRRGLYPMLERGSISGAQI